jgi:hypothetical protein
LGVPTIACARHPHYTFDFCRTARTEEEYEGMLETYKNAPVSREEMQRQALAFYYMHNLYGDADALVLRRAFLAFWKAANVGESTETSLISEFRALACLPAFDRFVSAMISEAAGWELARHPA